MTNKNKSKSMPHILIPENTMKRLIDHRKKTGTLIYMAADISINKYLDEIQKNTVPSVSSAVKSKKFELVED